MTHEPLMRQAVLSAFAVGVLAVQSNHKDLTKDRIEAIADDFLIGFLAALVTYQPDPMIRAMIDALEFQEERKRDHDQET